MLFNTLDFIVFFITVLTVFVIIKNRNFQYLFLLLVSYFFFYYTSNYLITLLIYTTIWDYYFGKLIWKTTQPNRRKILLICSLAGNLGLLGFFKYSDFAITQINTLGKYFNLGTNILLLNLALPIGISFYTFHSITYTVSIYRKQMEPAKSFLDYAIFVSFFPQLVAGPILRAKDFLPQLREKIENSQGRSRFRQIIVDKTNLKLGITMMATGFFKKMFIADNISPLVNQIFANSPHESFLIIVGAIAFGIQIYTDFSGYSDIAIGAATIMGFKMPINFNNPYFATSPVDFWRKWHISLSTWLRDYLYIPLGGNRISKTRTYANLLIVMFLGGLWHGASWNFVIWGLLHGIYLSIHKFFAYKFPFLVGHRFFKSKIGLTISIIITQYFIFLAWLAFRIKDTQQLPVYVYKYLVWDFSTNQTIQFLEPRKLPLFIMCLFFAMHYISYKKPELTTKISELQLKYWVIILISIITSILLLYSGNPEDFIYFQF